MVTIGELCLIPVALWTTTRLGGGWGWGRPTPEEEKEYLDDYIEMLKEELAAAEEYRKELAGSE